MSRLNLERLAKRARERREQARATRAREIMDEVAASHEDDEAAPELDALEVQQRLEDEGLVPDMPNRKERRSFKVTATEKNTHHMKKRKKRPTRSDHVARAKHKRRQRAKKRKARA